MTHESLIFISPCPSLLTSMSLSLSIPVPLSILVPLCLSSSLPVYPCPSLSITVPPPPVPLPALLPVHPCPSRYLKPSVRHILTSTSIYLSFYPSVFSSPTCSLCRQRARGTCMKLTGGGREVGHYYRESQNRSLL